MKYLGTSPSPKDFQSIKYRYFVLKFLKPCMQHVHKGVQENTYFCSDCGLGQRDILVLIWWKLPRDFGITMVGDLPRVGRARGSSRAAAG